MKYLVLGSAGQIGSALCTHLIKCGHDVMTFDIASNPVQDLRVANNPVLQRLMEVADFVFFLAWDVGGSIYLSKHQDSFDFLQNNVKITANTFDLLKKYNKPFLFASSQMANMSYSSYGLTKSLAEKITSAAGGITVKFWNVYGVEHNLAKTHVITDFIRKAKTTGVIDMFTDGSEYRQMLHAADCSECLYILSTQYNDLPRDKQYHISSFEWITVLDIAKIVAGYFPGTIIKPADSKDMIQKDVRYEADPWILNYWKPQTTLSEGIKNIIDEMKGN